MRTWVFSSGKVCPIIPPMYSYFCTLYLMEVGTAESIFISLTFSFTPLVVFVYLCCLVFTVVDSSRSFPIV